METLQGLLKHVGGGTYGPIRTAPMLQYQNLTVIPLIIDTERVPTYVTLDEALQTQVARVTEVSQQGSVPELRFINDSEQPVLLLDGEELVGSKQNRVLNLTILAPAKQSLVVPVSCVEQRRWGYNSTTMSSSGQAQHASGRALKIRSVTASMVGNGSRRSNQSQVWSSVSTSSVVLGVTSATNSMSDIYARHAKRIEEYVDGVPAVPGQSGAIFAVNGDILGLAVFDTSATFSKLYPKLVRSYAIEALPGEPKLHAPDLATVSTWLEAAGAGTLERFPAVGLGTDVRLSATNVAGTALVVDDRLIHLEVMAVHEPMDAATVANLMNANIVREDANPDAFLQSLLREVVTTVSAEQGFIIDRRDDKYHILASVIPEGRGINGDTFEALSRIGPDVSQAVLTWQQNSSGLVSIMAGTVTVDGKRLLLWVDNRMKRGVFKPSHLVLAGDAVIGAQGLGGLANAVAWPSIPSRDRIIEALFDPQPEVRLVAVRGAEVQKHLMVDLRTPLIAALSTLTSPAVSEEAALAALAITALEPPKQASTG